MRDPLLYPFYADIDSLPGVGPKVKPTLARLIGGETVLDLLFHLPVSWIDRRNRATISSVEVGEVATITGVVDELEHARNKLPARVRLRDDTGFITLSYFHANKQWLERTFKIGESVIASGTISEYHGARQMAHPDHVVPADADADLPEVEPVYPMTANLTGKALRKFMAAALAKVPELDEWIDPHLLSKNHWPSFSQALLRLHQPKVYDPDGFHIARTRLAYDEALAREMAMGQARLARERRHAPSIPRALGAERAIVEALPFKPTRAQMDAYSEVAIDMGRPVPMRRMIQGDVGSGKTLVAALAAAQVAADGGITAVMSPTEVLARQQAEAIGKFLAPVGMKVVALTGRDKGAGRQAILDQVRAGKIQVLSGTQALYQSDVDLPDLALVVIDEQHRFGVADRLKLTSKGQSPHMLVMSATPIPRTMALAVHGDLDMSFIREKPANRQEVTTAAVPDTRIDEVIAAVSRAVDKGERAFWICPAVDSEDAGDASAIARRDVLSAHVRSPVEIVHGRMPAEDRDTALEKFRAGKAGVLVATTVIEVGVDVPEATIMVIEHAEKFGLAQLHQLRGRVGRGDKASSCLLLYQSPLTDSGKERLDILRKSTDGFDIAEADFRLRGPGDLLGLRQSGLPAFRVLDISQDTDLIETARTDAKSILMADPQLEGARGKAVRRARDLFAPRIASQVTEAADD
ncbi:MAG TPA: ATP-dependent DNA helicase RecG [Hyphomonadaceae bacterium]|jgi:ATP-dependent DNA helicase RecG|nr:ATP-dependent DNA helicase RecG [Hyphomonadaceae bacterium]